MIFANTNDKYLLVLLEIFAFVLRLREKNHYYVPV